MKQVPLVLAVLLGLSCAGIAPAKSKINGSIEVATAEQAGDLSTINGSIHVAANGSAKEISTVNGSVQLGKGARAESIDVVNGGIELDEGAKVARSVSSVNGKLRFANGADVGGGAGTVNGSITLESAHVGGGLKTVSGDIRVGAGARVEGGIRVNKPKGRSNESRVPRVIIGPGAVIQGELVFEREVELLVSDRATIGAITGATARTFAGEQP